MDVSQKDLVIVAFPFTNFRQTKVRPAIVISNNVYNKQSADVLAVPVTSNPEIREWVIPLTNSNLSKGRLLKESRIKVDKIFSVEKRLIQFVIGRVNNETYQNIVSMIHGLTDDR